jgi:hypothetical protein
MSKQNSTENFRSIRLRAMMDAEEFLEVMGKICPSIKQSEYRAAFMFWLKEAVDNGEFADGKLLQDITDILRGK